MPRSVPPPPAAAAAPSAPAPESTPASFEAALNELEAIVRAMETSQLPLEASLTAYERGASLLNYCQDALTAAERKLQILENNQLRELTSATGRGSHNGALDDSD